MIEQASAPMPQRIMVIHALEESVLPARSAFAAHWPEAAIFDLLDTSLAVDLEHAGQLDDVMMARFQTLADYAKGLVGKSGKTSAILFTCSAFGPAIDAVKRQLDMPVLRPNESACAAAIGAGKRIGLVVTFEPSLAALSAELQSMAAQAGKAIEIKAVVADGALTALKAGDGTAHDRLALDAAKRLNDVDIIILGQFSLARAKLLIESEIAVPILTTPAAAVAALKSLCSSSKGNPL